MPTKEKSVSSTFDLLEKWIRQNKKANLKNTNLNDPTVLEAFNWKGLEQKKEPIRQHLKAYQRLLKIVPDANHKLLMILLGENIHSAIQVASQPKQVWLDKHTHLFKGQSTPAEDFYDKAAAIKARLLLKHVQRLS